MTPTAFDVHLLTVGDLGEGGGGTPPGGGAGITVEGSVTVDIGASPFNVTLPADVQENDILYAFAGGRSGATFGPPATYAGQDIYTYDEGGNTRIDGWWRRAGAGEGGTTEQWTSSNISRQNLFGLVVLRGCIETGDPQDVPHVKSSGYVDTPACPAGATLTANSCVVWMYGQRYNGTAPTEDTGYPATTDEGLFRQWFSSSILGCAYKVIESAGAYPGDLWGQWAGENNLAIATAVIFKRQA